MFYESTHRIMKAMTELGSAVLSRPLVVCRELTKMYEHVYRGSAAEVIKQVGADSTKGEFVVVVGPREK